jgi:Arc/MetJ-type ribon-helix-helix transcriptional regulator
MVLAGGNITPEPAHSGMESLIARGFYPEAAEQLRAHLVAAPGDHAARFKLADLYRRHLDNPLAAERLYLEVRSATVAPREEMFAGNMLIELYRETGRKDRQIVELARFAERWRGTAAGRSAAAALKELKQDLPER